EQSGTSSMSDSLICWKPRIDEPSKPAPSISRPSLSSRAETAKCCQVPGRSVNFRSTRWTSLSRAKATTSSGVAASPSRSGSARGGPSGVGSGSLITDTGLSSRDCGVSGERNRARPRSRWPHGPSRLARRSKRVPRGPSDLEPLVLEVELALDAVHHVVGDRAVVAQRDDRRPLGLEHLPHEPLVGRRAVLVAIVLDLPGARLQPAAAVVVEAGHPLDRVVAGPVLRAELLDPRERRLRRDQPRAQLLALLAVVGLDVEDLDELGQGEPLAHERREDHGEREEHDEVALRRPGRDPEGARD